ncbi:MAG: hypothetical protein OCD01_15725 [Fibrobacterales bacterium]
MRALILSLLLNSASLIAGYSPFSHQGEASFDELKMYEHPREAALAGSGSALSISATEAAGNPLSLSQASHFFISAATTSLPSQLAATSRHLTLGSPLSSFALAFTSHYIEYEPFTQRDSDGRALGEYTAKTIHLSSILASDSGTYAWAARLHYGYNTIHDFSSHALFISGYGSFTYNDRSAIQLSVENLGAASKMNQEELYLPLTLQVSLGHTVWKNDILECRTFADFKKINEEPFFAVIAQEIALYDHFSLRGGYNFHTDQSWSVGGGIEFFGYSIDYAYQNHQYLEGSHSVSFALELE